MNTMRMPGFTAETSVYASGVCYRSFSSGPRSAGEAVIPSQVDCLGFQQKCSECIPVGPSIFSPGRQFCQFFTCQPTISGGCRCRLLSKGFVSCSPAFPGGVLTTS
jgi:hypothetical protein